MKKGRQKLGFTIIEVALVLAIMGVIFIAIMSNTASRVANRRYFDAVNDLTEELRNAYSAAINVENYRRNTEDSSFFCSITSAFKNNQLLPDSPIGTSDEITDNLPGRTRCAFYGQVITFGEDSNDPDPYKQSNIHRYDIIGIAKTNNIEPGDGKGQTTTVMGEKVTSDDILETLLMSDAGVGANIVTIRNKGKNTIECKAGTAGTSSMYSTQWGARIENRNNHNIYRGAIMIARSPLSGTIHTYFYSSSKAYDVLDTTDSTMYDDEDIAKRSYHDNPEMDETFMVQRWLNDHSDYTYCTDTSFNVSEGLFINKAIREGKMVKDGNLDICIGSEDVAASKKRRAIRIHGDGSNESAVELLTEKDSALVCKDV